MKREDSVTEPCVFDHLDDGVTARAAPGKVACTRCTDRVWRDLNRLQQLYDGATDVDELIPGGSPDSAGRSVPGPRSPAVDSLIVHTDPRSSTGPGESPAALASIVGWAKLVREDTTVDVAPEFMLAVVPKGRVTMGRELAAIRGAWPWVAGQPWFLDFATEVKGVINALVWVRRMHDKQIQIGGCEKVILAIELANREVVELKCGNKLRVRPGDVEIRCKNCGEVWPRDRWRELGEPWADFATISEELDVPVGTLWRWASKDQWESKPAATSGTGRRRLQRRADALASYEKYRGNLLGEAG